MKRRSPPRSLRSAPAFVLLAVFAPAAPAPDAVIAHYRQNLLTERRAAGEHVEKIQENIEKLTTLAVNLRLPQQLEEEKKARANIAAAREDLKQTTQRIQDLESFVASPCLALPTFLEGQVRLCPAQGDCQVADGSRPFLEGEHLQTGPNGSLLLAVEDGSRLILEPDSELEFKERTPSEVTYRLNSGRMHLTTEPEPVQGLVGQTKILTPTVEASLQAGRNDMDFIVDGNRRTHLLIREGGLEVAADPSGVRSSDTDDWWKKALPSDMRRQLTGTNWFRVAGVEKAAAIWGADGAARRVAIGDELRPTESLAAGPHGGIWGFMEGDSVGAVEAGSILRYRGPAKPASAQARRFEAAKRNRAWDLEKGAFYFSTKNVTEESPLPDLQMSDSLAEFPPSGRFLWGGGLAFEAKAFGQGPNEWVPLEGRIRITARRKALRP